MRLWDVKTGECLKILQGHTDSVQGHTNSVRAVAFSPVSISAGTLLRPQDAAASNELEVEVGQILASGGEDQAVRLCDVTTGQCCKTLQGYSNPI